MKLQIYNNFSFEQLAEQRSCKPQVKGSSPFRGLNYTKKFAESRIRTCAPKKGTWSQARRVRPLRHLGIILISLYLNFYFPEFILPLALEIYL